MGVGRQRLGRPGSPHLSQSFGCSNTMTKSKLGKKGSVLASITGQRKSFLELLLKFPGPMFSSQFVLDTPGPHGAHPFVLPTLLSQKNNLEHITPVGNGQSLCVPPISEQRKQKRLSLGVSGKIVFISVPAPSLHSSQDLICLGH